MRLGRIVHFLILFCAFTALASASGCVAKARVTHTERTAVEQALLAEAAESALSRLKWPAQLEGQTFRLDVEGLEKPDKHFLFASLERKLLIQGMLLAPKPEEADIAVTPRIPHVGTDHYVFFLGIPSIPLITLGGSISTPELALFKRDMQTGRNRMGVHAFNVKTGKMVVDMPEQSSQRHYTQYTLLFFIHWRKTDLDEPF
jgi:hypothetical protein